MAADVTAQLKVFYDGEMAARVDRPLGSERATRLADFVAGAVELGCRSVIEVGCGAGRDGVVLQRAGLEYTGVDLSTSAVRMCNERGLVAIEGLATDLPFEADSFDSAWSMSTLMHLPGDQFRLALAEIGRVVRSGGMIEIGVWGHDDDREWTAPDGRYFKHRSDATLRNELSRLGELVAFATWDRFDDGGHYQWARVLRDKSLSTA